MEKSDKILVTGAAGLVGWHVKELLAREGHSVAAITRKECDLTDWNETRSLFADIRPLCVIHCAAKVFGILGNMQNQGESYLINTRINTNVIEAARLQGVVKITAMGTGAVYPAGDLPNEAYDDRYCEGDIFQGRPHPSEAGYAHAKLGMLAMLEAYKESYGMDFAFVVSCNLFGPHDTFNTTTGHVIPSLIRKFYEAKRDGTTVLVWGDGSAQRDFLYVKDAARAVKLIAEEYNGPINMGSGAVWSIREIVRVLTKISGLPRDRVMWDSSKPNGQDHRAYDLNMLGSLGFAPNHSIAAGLRETWDWYCHEEV